MTQPNTQSNARKSERTHDFKYLPCDSINLALSDNGIKIILGVEELDSTTLELVGIHMTHKTAALLVAAIMQSFDHYKDATGIEIPIPTVSGEAMK
ncbi:hypothetical protein [Pseudotabrizicola sp. 4114]|uniref:hypothetical protein n=1 Tax=Pseudotabrizicola sp. 4114 TaxID=2817731 RepID=UPI00285DE193|nr:hypothetical protein [Pseudorhodobacter sp. 4114]